MVKEILAACEGLKIDETREVSDDYAEFVVLKSDVEQWSEKIATVVGPAAKPAGEKPSSADTKVTDSFGGIQKEQTLFYKDQGDSMTVVMFWPWRDDEHVTVKVARTKAAAAAAGGGGGMSMLKWAIISVLILVVVVAIAGMFAYRSMTKRIGQTAVEHVDPATVGNGTYEATCDLTLVSATVRVVVEDGHIGRIDLVEHGHGPGYGADEIVGRIVAAQSVMVDAVSGATGSSIAIRKAVELALRQGAGLATPPPPVPEDSTEEAPAEETSAE